MPAVAVGEVDHEGGDNGDNEDSLSEVLSCSLNLIPFPIMLYNLWRRPRDFYFSGFFPSHSLVLLFFFF